jgi:RNA-directed DNA polymerase
MLMETYQIPDTQSRRVPVSEIQRRLAHKATEEPGHRFGHLYDLLTWETVLREAAHRLRANKGSRTAGIDGMDRRVLQGSQLEHHLAQLQQQLRAGTYQPSPVRRVYIPKRNGKRRPLGIPTLYDRWVQMALKVILEPIYESDFANYSHGFRPQRSCHTAVAHIHKYTQIRKRKYYWVIEGDIEGFFDHVHHKKLMALLRQRIRDPRLLDLLWHFLKAGVMEGQLFGKTEEGTPQGGVLSPLLANVYLNHFDLLFARRAALGDKNRREKNRQAGGANFVMVRYADDFVIFSNGPHADTIAFKQELKEWLANELHLTLSEEKTAITHFCDGFNFLGFTFKKTEAKAGKREIVTHFPSTESVQRAIQHVSDLTDRCHVRRSREDVIDAVNTFLRGWGEYYRHSAAKGALSYIGWHTYRRMWKWLLAKDRGSTRRGWRKIEAKYHRNQTWQVGSHELLVLARMKIEYPYFREIPNPYLTGETVRDPRHQDPFFLTYWNGARRYGPDWTPNRDEATEEHGAVCIVCGSEERVEMHHIKARRQGGGNEATNLVPLCPTHHHKAENRNSAEGHIVHEKKRLGSGEPGALKGASPVRGEGL